MSVTTKIYYEDEYGHKRKAFDKIVAKTTFMIGYKAVWCRRFVRLLDLDTGRQVKRYAIVGGKVLI